MAGRSGRLGSAALGLSVSESQLNDIDGIQASTRPLLDQISLCAGPCAEPAGPEGPEARCLSWEFIVQGRSRLSTAMERCRCHRAGQWGMARRRKWPIQGQLGAPHGKGAAPRRGVFRCWKAVPRRAVGGARCRQVMARAQCAAGRVASPARPRALVSLGCREPAGKAGSRGRAGAWTLSSSGWEA